MKCSQLGGPDGCDEVFQAEAWEEMRQLSMQHGHEMKEKGDESHLKAMEKMSELMNDPEAMQEWMDERKKEFDELAED